MLTEPLLDDIELEINDVVKKFASTTFTVDRVRGAGATPIGHDPVVWKQMGTMGLSGMSVAEEYGGSALGARAACVVHRELGRRVAPSPFLATVGSAATALDLLSPSPIRDDTLRLVAEGAVTLSLLADGPSSWTSGTGSGVRAEERLGDWVLSGSVPCALGADTADSLIVIAHTGPDSFGVFCVDPDDDRVFRCGHPTVDLTRRYGSVRLDDVPASAVLALNLDSGFSSRVADRLAVRVAAELVGCGLGVFALTLEHLNTREQFGVAIGTFQALKHRMADAALALTIAQESLFAAATHVEARRESDIPMAAALALVDAGRAALVAVEEGIQLHGAVGFTDEFPVGLYYKRVITDLELLASPTDALERVSALRHWEDS